VRNYAFSNRTLPIHITPNNVETPVQTIDDYADSHAPIIDGNARLIEDNAKESLFGRLKSYASHALDYAGKALPAPVRPLVPALGLAAMLSCGSPSAEAATDLEMFGSASSTESILGDEFYTLEMTVRYTPGSRTNGDKDPKIDVQITISKDGEPFYDKPHTLVPGDNPLVFFLPVSGESYVLKGTVYSLEKITEDLGNNTATVTINGTPVPGEGASPTPVAQQPPEPLIPAPKPDPTATLEATAATEPSPTAVATQSLPTPEATVKPYEEPEPTPPPKTLTDTQTQQLTSYLEELSRDWHQPSVDAANNLLRDESLGPEAWKSFFSEYFSNHTFTDGLRNYLGYPVYWWFSETAHTNLQQGLYDSLTDIINNQTDAYIQSDRDSLTRTSPIIQSLINSHRFLNDMIRLQSPDVEYREDIFNFYRTLAEDKGPMGLIYGNTPLDVTEHPFAGGLRAQAHMNLIEALDLTDPIRAEIADILELTSNKGDIFDQYHVLIIDNQGLDETQLQVIQSLLESVPRELYNLGNISVNEFIGNTDDKYLWFLNKAGVNIFGVKVGNARENGFPDDVPPYDADGFSLALVHEFNHIVDNFYVNGNDLLKKRKETLLAQAGLDDLNYLRSTPGNGDLFQNAPQEFFASISNQYFASSEHTLRLGLERLAQGRPEPLNQFLFAADVYSLGGDSTLFYTLDTAGNLTRQEIPIVRDNQGRITEIHLGTEKHKFQLDDIGNIVSVNPLGG
jgi:hypothetical protein